STSRRDATRLPPTSACSAPSCSVHHTTTPVIYTLSLHDALPISVGRVVGTEEDSKRTKQAKNLGSASKAISAPTETTRSEERFSRNAETDLVCRHLLEKKKYGQFHQHHSQKPRD